MKEINKNIVFVGSGIKFYAHLTVECISHIENADIVLYLVNEPAMMQWLQENSKRNNSLEAIYNSYPNRADAYNAISNQIIESLEIYSSICVVIYGHPLVLCMPTRLTINNAPKNVNIKILPGIAADSCLYADLGIDPVANGCQSYEATEFLLYQKKIDATANLILWQVGVIGCLGDTSAHNNQKGISLLKERLLTEYPQNHSVTLYEATQYAHIASKIVETPLYDLDNIEISQLMTLYVPPLSNRSINVALVEFLKNS